MTLNSHRPSCLTVISGTLLSLLYLTSPTIVLAGAGHSHGNEFQDGGGANVEATSVVVDQETAKGLQIKTQPVQRQRLAVGIKTTGQVEVTLGETYRDLVEVKTGLFKGDVIVTQRAPQLYAQALKGGGKPKEHSDENSEEHTTEKTTDTTVNQSTFSWWMLIATGGILAGGMFWAGSVYGNCRQKGTVIMDTLANTPNGVNLDSHSSEPLKNVDSEFLENPEKH